MKISEIRELSNDELVNEIIYNSGDHKNGVLTNRTINDICKMKKELMNRLGDLKSYTDPF